MWQLYQFPLCPFSRKVRLQMEEKGIAYEAVRESPWLRRDEFLDLNPVGQTPVLVDTATGTTLIHSCAISEYLEETVEPAPMIPGNAAARGEIRRLVAYFDEKFYADVVGPLFYERALKRIVHISVADYLGGIDWRGHEETRQWYSGMKSRRSLRVLLAERMELVSPPEHYEKPDF